MVSLHPEYVVDDQHRRKAVLLPVDEWEQVVDELEELEDIRLYDAAKEQAGEALPFEQAIEEIDRDRSEGQGSSVVGQRGESAWDDTGLSTRSTTIGWSSLSLPSAIERTSTDRSTGGTTPGR